MFTSKEEAIALMKERTKKIKITSNDTDINPRLQVQYQ
jgi:hypothetical protein